MTVRARFLGGLSWKAVSQATFVVTRLAVVVVLARLLEPRDYGLAAMALAITAIATALADVSPAPALVQRRELTPTDLATALWSTLAIGAVATATLIAVSGPIASYFGEPEVQPLVAVLALGLLLNSPAVVQSALLQRRLAFRASELSVTAGAIAGAAVGIAVAASDGGAWALVAQQLTGIAITAAALWIAAPWRPAPVLSRESLRHLAPFSLRLYGGRLLFGLSRTLDDVLVGRYLGPRALGLYGLAYNVVISPFARVADPVRAVLYPLLAETQDDQDRVGELWLRTTVALAAFFLPALTGLAVVAPDLVRVVLGERWEDAAPVIRILAGVALLQVFVALATVVLAALDKAATILRLAVATAAVSVVGFAAGIPFGIQGVAWGYLAANVLVVPATVTVTARAVGRRARDLLYAVRGVVEATALMAVACIAAQAGLVELGLGPWPRLLLVSGLGIVVYLVSVRLRAPELAAEVARLRADVRERHTRVQ